jgi:hypothetical protein
MGGMYFYDVSKQGVELCVHASTCCDSVLV